MVRVVMNERFPTLMDLELLPPSSGLCIGNLKGLVASWTPIWTPVIYSHNLGTVESHRVYKQSHSSALVPLLLL